MFLFCQLPLNLCKILNFSVHYKQECRTKSVRKDSRVEVVKKKIWRRITVYPLSFFITCLIVKTFDFTIKTDGKTKYSKFNEKYKPEELWHWSEAHSVVHCIPSVYVLCAVYIIFKHVWHTQAALHWNRKPPKHIFYIESICNFPG